MAATTITTTNNAKTMLYITVIAAFITSQFLSVEAIRCHQCNSHLIEDCTDLRLNTPRAQRDEQFLKDCEVENNIQAFCRKVVLHMEVSGEKRVVRECGWIRENSNDNDNNNNMNNTVNHCHSAEHVGYKQTICVCENDGCNGSESLVMSKWAAMGMSALSLVAATVLRWN